jgi:DNA polymerase-3 subunit delta'
VPEDLAVQREIPVLLDERRKPSKQIRVDEVRDAMAKAVSTSGRGRGRALVIFPGEAMNAVAASALLKTLEEPAPGMRIAICAAEPARLLPTIRSRCQRLVLPRPTPAQALEWLGAQGVPQAEALLAGCSGRPLQALALHAAGMTGETWRSLPGRIGAGDASALASWGVPAAVEALAKICHDAMARAVGAEPRFFPAAALPASPRLPRLSAWQRSLQAVQRHADHPWNEPLLLDALVAEGRDALAS